ncbi:MAG: glycosyltransferase family 2 protein [Gammaproteobacteria bacterium]|nr:MAG: glycosyltransferase family 2 protein [Gammaproteobacteria bacterium]
MSNSIIKNISCVIIAKNAESTIENTLTSLAILDDIVVYNNGSTDTTYDIAKKFHNVNLVQGEFIGFGPTKNKAASFAKHDWILSLDADEVLSSAFIDSLKRLDLDENNIYTILRENFYRSRQIKYCWGNDIIPRIYNKQTTSFTNKNVHEGIIVEGLHIKHIDGVIKHYPYSSMTDFIIKLDRYSTLFAIDKQGKKSSSPLKAICKANYDFFKTYVLKRGFLDGYPGLLIAFSHMATTFYKHMKLYEMNKNLQP